MDAGTPNDQSPGLIIIGNHIRRLSALLVIIAITLTGIRLDSSPEIYPSSPVFAAPLQREKSSPTLVSIKLPDPPAEPLHLPVVADKPARASRTSYTVALASNDADHPRVAKVLGKGPYRNKYGASCVALIQAKGFTLQVGAAKNIPAIYRAAGYAVDGRIDDGAAFVTAESSAGGTNTGHTGIVLDASDPDYVYVQEQNYRSGMLTEGWVARSSIIQVVHPLSHN